MSDTLGQLIEHWSIIAAHSPTGAGTSLPFLLDDDGGELVVVCQDSATAAFLTSSPMFLGALQQVAKRKLVVRVIQTDESGFLFARAILGLDRRLSRLERGI